MLQLSFDLKGYGVKNATFYVLDLVYLTSLMCAMVLSFVLH